MYQFDPESPSDIDVDYYRKLIDSDSKPPININIDPIEPTDDNSVSEILDNNTFQGFPSSMDALVKKAELEKKKIAHDASQVSEMFQNLFNDLNEKYGLEVKIDSNSFSKSLEYIIQPKNKKALELYLSEAYGRVRVVLYTRYLNAITLLSEQILNPQYLLSESMSYESKLIIVKQLYEFMNSLNEIYEKVNVSDVDLKLGKLSEEVESDNELGDPKVKEFLDNLARSIKDN